MESPVRLRAEDLPVGVVLDLGPYDVTSNEIIEFARQWDPQPFHVDPDFAATTAFGGLIGSGLHTMAIFQRLAVLGAYRKWAIVAGRAMRGLELTSPLRPGTTVRATVEITAVSPKNAERSLVTKTGRLLEGDLQLMTAQVDSYVLRRRLD